MRLVALPVFALMVLLPSGALAQEPQEPQEPQPSPADAPELGPGLALGYENGLWGQNFAQAVRLRLPFSPQWGLMVKAVLTHPSDHIHNFAPHFGGGRLEIFGGSRPIGGFMRVYGGGGPVLTTKVLGTGGNTDVHYGVGGYFGFEIFSSRRVSWFIEIGGSSNPDGSAAGATANAGLQWYLGR